MKRDLLLKGMTNSFQKEGQTPCRYKTREVAIVGPAAYSFDQATEACPQISGLRYPIINQDESLRHAVHLSEYWKTLAFRHLVKDHAGRGTVKRLIREMFQSSTITIDNLHIVQPAGADALA